MDRDMKYSDGDDNLDLSYAVDLSDGSDLPDFIQFENNQLSVNADQEGQWLLRITA